MKFGSSTLLSVISCLLTTTSAFQIHKTLPSPTKSSSTSLQMVTTGPLHCRPIGIGSAAPSTVITNQDLESVVETSDEWIRTRTGISERRVLLHNSPKDEDSTEDDSPPETIKTLASKAAQQALDMSGLDPESIDLVLVATSSPDDMFGDATSVAASLGCKNAMAFDLTAACSGFLFGITTAGQFLTNNDNTFNNAIVVGADALSRWIDWSDRNSCILFGDGAGAVVLQATEGKGDAGILGSSAHSNGLGYENLNCAYKGSPVTVNTPQVLELSSGSYDNLAMNGNEVYKFATRSVPRVIKEALVAADMEVEDVDWLLLHQANIRIMETVASRLGIPMEKVITNLSKYGNTSAASIPLALDEAVRSGQVKEGDVIACAGFGAGLSWGSAIMKWGGKSVDE
ncbi:3-oxoacyl- [Chaetoceros tenuissimus]|uniref:beta-ketoacyl-[acyl-carrier-protein] synthase III n=1 Tax=Chaetoceros tenuissimus TaxID=426638 RepID=A0AAD3DC57_9STRA|nr:3-oxoacyl- [Chaetoceros tenuissimus]